MYNHTMDEYEGEQLPLSALILWGNEHDKSCQHNWQKYHGFNEIYEFCTKCDEKRPIKEDEVV